MPRTCSVCGHPEREAIDAALVAGAANRRIATQYSLSEAAVRRHRRTHLPASLAAAKGAAEATRADDLLAQVRGLQTKALAILTRAEATGDLRAALAAIGQARSNLELLAKLLGELREHATVVNVAASAEWGALRLVVVNALDAHPEARETVILALKKEVARQSGQAR